MLTPIHFPAKCGTLQRTAAQIEGERDQGIELPIRERNVD
jgi:hypothetical protein